MTKYFSEEAGGFIASETHRGDLPADAVEVSEGVFLEMLAAREAGKVVEADSNGAPVAVDPPVVSPAAKTVRDLALAALVYDFGDGRIMQTRPSDEQNIAGAILVMGANDILGMDWVMADNVKHPVTVNELQAALDAGRLAALQVWSDYVPE